ncbi:ABC transporter permease [Bacteroidota bacterium]
MKQNKKPSPPYIVYAILKLFTNDWKNASLVGDLEEEYFDIALAKGFTYARVWYIIQVIRSLPKLIHDSRTWGVFMFKNYMTIAWRNIKKYKGFSLINISGLAIGMACCILLFIYINSELSFDTYHEKGDRIFRVGEHLDFSDYQGSQSATNGVIAEALKKTYPEVQEASRFYFHVVSAKYNEKQFSNRFYYTDAAVFNIFTWPLIKGDPETALAAPFSIVLTEETANRYFGSEDPIGKTLTINEADAFKVTGVMNDIPEYSTYSFAGLMSFNTLYGKGATVTRMLTEWGNHNFETFILLNEGVDYNNFEDKIKDIYLDYMAEELAAKGASYEVFLQPLQDIYLRPYWHDFGPIMYVYIFSAVALFVLLIACANFMNLSTARSLKRAAEVGMRKVLGANRGRLINQFLSEAILLSLLSMILAIGLVVITLPQIDIFVNRNLSEKLFDIPWLIPGILGITLLVGLVAGSYPAFFLSKFRPVETIKGGSKSLKGNTNFRRGLVLLQFSISIILIIGTSIVIQQLNYLRERDPGFNKEHVLFFTIKDELVRQNLSIVKEKIKNLPEVINAAAASNLPGWGAATNDKIPEGYTSENMQLMLEVNVDEDYFSTLGIELVSGRNFSKDHGNDPRGSVIINEAAVKKYNWDDPIGKTIKTLNFDNPNVREWEGRTVIGVVKDYHIQNVTSEIEPAFIANVLNHPWSFGQMRVLAIKIQPGTASTAIASIKEVWEDTFPQKPLRYHFLDEDYDWQFRSIERSRDIFSYFTFMAIFIACLGLFGMAAYTVENRIKEIGIRKTLGSSITQIVTLLSREFIYIVLAANVIAYPIAYLLISNWLEEFPYKIEIAIETFLFSTLIALGISFLTTAYQSIKAARTNPIESLRTE